MYIDDNPSLVPSYSPSTLKYANQIPIFVLNDYKSNCKVTGSNIYHVKTTISDIQPIHFVIGTLEYRIKNLEQGTRALKQQNRPSSPTLTWLIVIPIVSIVLACLVWILVWKN